MRAEALLSTALAMSNQDTTAIHAVTDTGDHIVGIGHLRVLLVAEGEHWHAQGLEIDYMAQGSTIDEAKVNFETGFLVTIEENLRVHGSIEPLLNVAPPEVWKDLLDPSARLKIFNQLTVHERDDMAGFKGLLPFQAINYLQYVQ